MAPFFLFLSLVLCCVSLSLSPVLSVYNPSAIHLAAQRDIEGMADTLNGLYAKQFALLQSAQFPVAAASAACTSSFQTYAATASSCQASLLPPSVTTFSFAALNYAGIENVLDTQCAASGCLSVLAQQMTAVQAACTVNDYSSLQVSSPSYAAIDFNALAALPELLCRATQSVTGQGRYCITQLQSSINSINQAASDLSASNFGGSASTFFSSSLVLYETICNECIYKMNNILAAYGIGAASQLNIAFASVYCTRDNSNNLCLPQLLGVRVNNSASMSDTGVMCSYCFQRVLGGLAMMSTPTLLNAFVSSATRALITKYCSYRRPDGESCFKNLASVGQVSLAVAKYLLCKTEAALWPSSCPSACAANINDFNDYGCCFQAVANDLGLGGNIFAFLQQKCNVPSAFCPVTDHVSFSMSFPRISSAYALSSASQAAFTQAVISDLAFNLGIDQSKLNLIETLATYAQTGQTGVSVDFRVNVTYDAEATLLYQRAAKLLSINIPAKYQSGVVLNGPDAGSYMNVYVGTLPAQAQSAPASSQQTQVTYARLASDDGSGGIGQGVAIASMNHLLVIGTFIFASLCLLL